ncbi:MAG: MEDS domain-containing protein [Acidobacteria bacterium]|nr:MEDS domain-containing protein [Acidobacteriota bacterium]
MPETGIDTIGDAPWGTHFCLLYGNTMELTEILVPYFKAGLENNEVCMWISSPPISVEKVESALRNAIPAYDQYKNRNQIQLLLHSEWYHRGTALDLRITLKGWLERVESALAHGYAGLRVAGDSSWAEKQHWKSLVDYETAVNELIGTRPFLSLCTYPLKKCTVREILDIIRNHVFSLVHNETGLELIESSGQKQRLAERTAELLAESSARRKSQETVQEQARFLEAFFRYSINPLVFLDKQFNFIRVNQAYAQSCQRESDEFIGHNHFEFYPNAENQAIFEEVVRTKKPYVTSAKPFCFPDHPEWGETYWDWTLVPVLDSEGDVDFLFFALIDVTRAKRAEENLRSSYNYSRGLLEASLDPLVTINTSGEITDVNKATEHATGVSRAQLIGSKFADFFTDPKKANDGYQRVFEEGFVRDYLLTIRHVSGAELDVLYNATVYRSEDGRIQGVFAAARDITELKAAEKRRDLTNALLKLFTEKSSLKEYLDSVLLIIRDWSGCQALGIRIVDADQKIPYGSWQGFSQDFLEMENNLSLASHDCLCIRAITGKFENQDSSIVTAGGSFRCDDCRSFVGRMPVEEQAYYRGHCIKFGFTSLTVIPIKYRDYILGAIHMVDSREAFFPPETVEFLESIAPLIGEAIHRFNAEQELAKYRDHLEELVRLRTEELEAANAQLQTEIAERRIADENLRQTAEELVRSNRDLEQFAYVASHDLQEPLRAVSGYIQLLQQRYADKLDEKALQYIEGAVDGAARMQRLITDLLAFSRVGTRERTLAWTDLTIPLTSALENLRVSIREADAKISCYPLPKLNVDSTQISQLFQNLIANAIKFRSKHTLEIHIGAKKREKEWLLSVKDNGIGIHPQYTERIFMIFQRLHTRRKYPGTGIGLAICKKIVERHGGKIWVESTPEKGSTFYFTIPCE